MDVIATPSASPAPRSRRLEALIADIEPARVALAGHGIYAALRTPAHLRTFLEHHVFAVWDFMSLVKTLQLALTCTRVPWVPRGDPQLRRFVHEIVLGEESDIDARGEVSSHFEVYVRAMRSCGADTGPITRFVKAVSAGALVDQALDDSGAPPAAARFVRHTFSVLAVGAVHEVAASFTFAREDVIPVMFRQFVDDLRARFPGGYDDLAWYLDRHVAVDTATHGPLARRLVTSLCGDDDGLWRSAQRVARHSLEARQALWDGIVAALPPAERTTARPLATGLFTGGIHGTDAGNSSASGHAWISSEAAVSHTNVEE